MKSILDAINLVRTNKGEKELPLLNENMTLRGDIGFDSLDLAELTVRIEKETGIDIFAEGLVNTIGEVLIRLRRDER